VTVNAGGTLAGTNQDAFGSAGFAAPGTITINGGTVTDLGTSNYRVTLPNLIFTGGTLSSAAGNAGDGYGNFSLYGNGASASVVTNASATRATISAASIAVELPTTFTVAAGNTSSGVDLIVSSNLNGSFSPFGSYGITKSGPGTMELTAANTYPGNTTITAGTLAISGSIASTTITLDGSSNFASLKLMSATALSSNAGLIVDTANATSIVLDFNGNQTVATWEINGTYAQPGTYSPSNEPAGYPALLTSDLGDDGTLTVAVPEPSLAGAGMLAMAGLMARRRRRSVRRCRAAAPAWHSYV
jgi:autotransporter-associated beta strand protein